MRGYAIAFALLAGPAWADWIALTGPQIQQALEGRRLHYDNAWQDFRASGRTLYNAGRDSWGYWAVRGDQYCSQWPPGERWDCYDMQRKDDMLRFVAGDGSFTDGTYAE